MNIMQQWIPALLCSALFMPSVALAQPAGGFTGGVQQGIDAAAKPAGLQTQSSIPQIIGSVINAILTFVGVYLILLFLYAGFKFMVSNGNSDQVKEATKMIRNAIIGLIIIVAAFALTTVVLSALSGVGTGATAV
jgi:lysylphosphatidylglycerol synthetase-like protein (DUF2156 family)